MQALAPPSSIKNLSSSGARSKLLFFMHSAKASLKGPCAKTQVVPTLARTQPHPVGDATPQAIIPLLPASPHWVSTFFIKVRAPSLRHKALRIMLPEIEE